MCRLPRLWRCFLWTLSFENGCQIGLRLTQPVTDFDFYSPVQLNLDTLAKLVLLRIMKVSNVILRVVVNHDASIESVEPQGAVVPFLCLLVQVPSVQAAELMDGCAVLGRGHREARGARVCRGHSSCHDHNYRK